MSAQLEVPLKPLLPVIILNELALMHDFQSHLAWATVSGNFRFIPKTSFTSAGMVVQGACCVLPCALLRGDVTGVFDARVGVHQKDRGYGAHTTFGGVSKLEWLHSNDAVFVVACEALGGLFSGVFSNSNKISFFEEVAGNRLK